MPNYIDLTSPDRASDPVRALPHQQSASSQRPANSAHHSAPLRPLEPIARQPSIPTLDALTQAMSPKRVSSSALQPPKGPSNNLASSFHSYASYIKPAQGFKTGYVNGWPASIVEPSKKEPHRVARETHRPEEDGEVFNLDVKLSANDYEKFEGDTEAHMRELLSAAIGEVEHVVEEGDDEVQGFSDKVRLMPHQVQGVKWMKGRESGRKYGGILADDMGLGKTVQMLARIVDGPATAAERKAGWHGGTLIVAPLAVMEQWASEVRSKTASGRLRVTTHHGPNRTKLGKALEQYDVVITTYQTMTSEHNETPDSDSESESGALFQVKWLRVVMDEAQNIKNRRAKSTKAACQVRAKYRWCLTGTPIQNSVEELFSLFQFLRAKPLDDWKLFSERISKPIKRGQVQIAMKRLHVILKAMMLRRTKEAKIDGKAIINLPERRVEIVSCHFDADERAFYDALEKKTELTFNKFLRAGTAMANYTSVLTMLLRLRQACDHPTLVTSSFSPTPDDVDELADMLGGVRVEESRKCDICFVECAETRCAECSARKVPQLQSAKIKALLRLLRDIAARNERSIVFSQFTSFLDLVEPFLRQEGVDYVRYDGSMRNDKRLASLEAIRTGRVRVILISFKAGSTGLNLTCCNNVVLMDMWWNPALEEQAFDRAHRLGQTRNVNIYKLRVEETVEDRILALQEKKRQLAQAALSGETSQAMKLSLNDIIDLFRRNE